MISVLHSDRAWHSIPARTLYATPITTYLGWEPPQIMVLFSFDTCPSAVAVGKLPPYRRPMYLAWEDHRLLWDHWSDCNTWSLETTTRHHLLRVAGLPYPTEVQNLHWCHSMRRHDWTKSQLQFPMRLVAEGCISTLAGRSTLLGSQNSWNRRLFFFR